MELSSVFLVLYVLFWYAAIGAAVERLGRGAVVAFDALEFVGCLAVARYLWLSHSAASACLLGVAIANARRIVRGFQRGRYSKRDPAG